MTNPTAVSTSVFNVAKLTQTTAEKKSDYHSSLTLSQEFSAGVTSTTDRVKYTFHFSITNPLFSQFKYQATEVNTQIKNLSLSLGNINNYNREVTKKNLLPRQDDIITERSKLINKKFKDGISKLEERRLKYLDWQLDRIDDALNGEHLDKLEKMVQMHEKLARSVGDFAEIIKNATPKASKHNKQKKKSSRAKRRK